MKDTLPQKSTESLKVLEHKNHLKSIDTLKSQLDVLQSRLISGKLIVKLILEIMLTFLINFFFLVDHPRFKKLMID